MPKVGIDRRSNSHSDSYKVTRDYWTYCTSIPSSCLARHKQRKKAWEFGWNSRPLERNLSESIRNIWQSNSLRNASKPHAANTILVSFLSPSHAVRGVWDIRSRTVTLKNATCCKANGVGSLETVHLPRPPERHSKESADSTRCFESRTNTTCYWTVVFLFGSTILLDIDPGLLLLFVPKY